MFIFFADIKKTVPCEMARKTQYVATKPLFLLDFVFYCLQSISESSEFQTTTFKTQHLSNFLSTIEGVKDLPGLGKLEFLTVITYLAYTINDRRN